MKEKIKRKEKGEKKRKKKKRKIEAFKYNSGTIEITGSEGEKNLQKKEEKKTNIREKSTRSN